MSFLYFSKVNKGTSWSSIKNDIQFQTSNNCKKMEYSEVVAIVISTSEFDAICNDISIPNPCYFRFAPQSVARLNGIWNCIILQNAQDTRKIILYTAGRVYPLYAAIEE